MQKVMFDKIISFLLGASWGIIILGALITFKLFLFLGIALSVFLTLGYVIVSMFLLLILDGFMVNRQRLKEAKKQTQLLEQILTKQPLL